MHWAEREAREGPTAYACRSFARSAPADALAYTDADGWTVVSKTADPSEFEVVLDSLIEFRGDSLADEDRDEIVETIAEAYETFTDRTLQ